MISLFDKYKHGIIILLLWLFAPLAWYIMWRDKKYHSWFPPLLLVNGIILIVVLLLGLSNTSTRILTLIFLLFCIVQIIYGVFLRGQKLTEKFVETHITLILFFLIIDVVIGAITGILSLILPLI